MSPIGKNQRGFSIVELLITMTVMLVVTCAIFGLLSDSMKFASTTYELTDAQQSLRVAHEFISRDLTNVGDGLNGVSINLPATFVRTYLTRSPLTDSSDPATAKLGIITSDDNVPPTTPVGDSAGLYVRSDPIRTDRITFLKLDRNFTPIHLPANAITPSGSNVSVSAVDIGQFSQGEIYFITSSVGATFGTITTVNSNSRNLIFADSDPYGLNHPGNGGPINVVSSAGTLPTSLSRVQIVQYFIDSRGLLIKRVFGVKGVGFSDAVIAEHVVNLQFQYLLDMKDANGQIVQPVSRLTTSQEQLQVRSVEVTITVETVHPIQNGSREQITMTALCAVRNMQFRQALQPTANP